MDNEIATALLCARGDTPTINGDDTATITTAYTDGTGDYKHSNSTVEIPSRTVLEICLILMETSMMHFFYE